MGIPLYRASVDQELCIGCGLCEETLPDVFSVGDFTASAATAPVPAEHTELLLIAARDCPVDAITLSFVEEASSGQAAGDDDEKGEDEEQGGEIREYKRKHGHPADSDEVEPHDAQRLERGKHDFSVVRNGTHDN